MIGGITVEGLRELRADVRRTDSTLQRDLTRALKRAGLPVISWLASSVPSGSRPDDHHRGQLRSGYTTSVRGSLANIVNRALYGAGAEWGQHGKWKGFLRYGPPGRFAWRSVEDHRDLIADIIYRELRAFVTMNGWAT